MTLKQIKNLSTTKNVLAGEFSEIRKMVLFLAQWGIYVDSICSDQAEYVGIRILNKPIHDITFYDNAPGDYTFILCASSESDIERYMHLFNRKQTNYITGADLDLDLYEEKISPTSVYRMIHDSRTKSLIIWGGARTSNARKYAGF